MERAVDNVRRRLITAAAALDTAHVPYAIAGGNAVALWVTTVDETAVRNTRDVDILLRRADLPQAQAALEAAGFVYRHVAGLDVFLDGPDAKARDAVHVVFAGEWVRPGKALPAPDVTDAVRAAGVSVLTLDALVAVKLTAWRDKDRVHLRDLLDVGLINPAWTRRLPPVLAARLQTLLDTPDG